MCKKFTLFIAVCLFATATAFANVQINATNFPDPNFRAFVSGLVSGRNVITNAEIANVTSINVSNRNISNLTGIHFFTNLTTLNAGINQLTALDVSALTNLTTLFVNQNQLIALDLTDLTNLSWFDGTNQTRTLTLTGFNNNYTLIIELNNPTNLANGLSYANGMLTSTSSAITSSPFSVQTGKPNFTLSGTLNLNYQMLTVQINAVNFPDPNFRAFVSGLVSGRNVITGAEIANVTSINVNSRNISNLTGINFFTNLTTLNVGGNQLTALNVSALTSLTNLIVWNNQLTALDVSNLTNLELLLVSDNQLISLDVSNLTNLTRLWAWNNQLTALDVSNLTNLTILSIFNNQLTALDVSNLTNLTSLSVGNNQLTSLDVSSLTNLTYLSVTNNQLTALDVSNLTNLTSLSVSNNQLTLLDVSNLTNLAELWAERNQLTSLDVSNLTNLRELQVSGNQLTSLDVSSLTGLRHLGVGGNQLTALDVSSLTGLNSLSVHGNQLTSLDISNLRGLQSLSAGQNQLTSLDVSNMLQWATELHVDNNQLTSLDVANLTGLVSLWVNGNQLTSLNVSNLTNLSHLQAGNNQFTSLDVANLTNLRALTVWDNQLTSLDVANLTNLEELNVSGNQLTALDVSNLTNLTWLIVSDNQLASLDVANLTNLTTLMVSNNQLTSLDLTGLNNLTNFWGNNQAPTLTLTGANNEYSLVINLNNPTGLVSGLSFADGVLTSTSNAISSSPFSVATGHSNPNFRLSGTLHLLYDCYLIHINEENFPDANFRNWLLEQTFVEDSITTRTKAGQVTEISLAGQNISDLTGIAFFPNLELLNVANNQLDSLDVSALARLTALNVAGNRLVSLDISNLPYLGWFSGNDQNPALTLTGANDNYRLSINLNNPTGLVNGLTFADGILTSTSNLISSSPFSVATGHSTFRLSGTLHLDYETRIVTPTENSVTIEWAQVEGAEYYELVIFADAGHTEKIADAVIDAQGNIIPRRSRSGAPMLSYTITGLDSNTQFFYTLTAFNSADEVINVSTGNFTTLAPTSLPEININRTPVAFYTITGVRLGQKPQSGIFIILYCDGSAEKVMR